MAGPFVIGLFLSLGMEIHQIIYWFAIPVPLACIAVILTIKVDPRGKALEEVVGK
jgi:hypothetical protein